MKKRMTILLSTILATTMLLSVIPVVNAADINETETKPTTVGKEVKINLQKEKTKKIPVGTSFKINVKNNIGKITYRVSNKKIIVSKNGTLKAKKNGKAIVYIKVNNKTYKYKLKATLDLKITYRPKNKIKLNVGQSKKIKKLYTYTTNLKSLKKFISSSRFSKYSNKVYNQTKKPTAKIKNTKYANISGKTINAKKKGSTYIIINCGEQSFTIPIIITRKTETTFKNRKAKIAYTVNEAYKLYKNALLNYYIKGAKPDYRYIQLAYASKLSWNKVYKGINNAIKKNYDQSDNFYSIEHQLAYEYGSENNNNTKYLDVDVYSKKERNELKKFYNIAQTIFKSINIYNFDKDYEKLIALNCWFEKNMSYGNNSYLYTDDTFPYLESVLYEHKGVCTDYTWATNYFCTLLKIPCISSEEALVGSNHDWNFVKVQEKWYHLDYLWNILLAGNNKIEQIDDYCEETSNQRSHNLHNGATKTEWINRISKTDFYISYDELKSICTKAGFDENIADLLANRWDFVK